MIRWESGEREISFRRMKRERFWVGEGKNKHDHAYNFQISINLKYRNLFQVDDISMSSASSIEIENEFKDLFASEIRRKVWNVIEEPTRFRPTS